MSECTHGIHWPANTVVSWRRSSTRWLEPLNLRSRPCMFSRETNLPGQPWFREAPKDLAPFQKVYIRLVAFLDILFLSVRDRWRISSCATPEFQSAAPRYSMDPIRPPAPHRVALLLPAWPSWPRWPWWPVLAAPAARPAWGQEALLAKQGTNHRWCQMYPIPLVHHCPALN